MGGTSSAGRQTTKPRLFYAQMEKILCFPGWYRNLSLIIILPETEADPFGKMLQNISANSRKQNFSGSFTRLTAFLIRSILFIVTMRSREK